MSIFLTILLILVIFMTISGVIALAQDNSFWSGFMLAEFLSLMFQLIAALVEGIANSGGD